MNRTGILLIIVPLLPLSNCLYAQDPGFENPDSNPNIRPQETLSSGLGGLNDQLADIGIHAGFGITNVYQQNVRGGISKHRRAGRFAGSYDLELSADVRKLFGIEGGSLYMLTEGVWSKSAGIDGPSVGSFFGVNGDARDRRSMDITELWYEHTFMNESLHLRLGKMDLTAGLEHRGCPVSFDCSTYANDEHTQFLNNALINNPTIPFPNYGLGLAVHYVPAGLWYLSAAVADARADLRETGFATTFHKQDHFFYIVETGLTPQLESANGPLQGACRAGLWYDPQNKEKFSDGKTGRDDTGFYLTFDQMLHKENDNPEDTQGLGAFSRYGWADSKVNEIANFWSVGLQYQGLVRDRDEDVLGLGFAQGFFSDRASAFTEDYESVWELYYSAQLTEWMALSPGIQYVTNPGGDGAASDAVVLGVRIQVSF
ncbi:MAG: carbohydrate porin [Planctomycetota bacterium]|jgi:porin